MTAKVKAVLFGCGFIGCSLARYAFQREDIALVGAIDIDRSLAGRKLGELSGVSGSKGDIEISDQADAVLAQTAPDLVYLATSSSLEALYPQVEQCAAAGANVISTCEELSYPYLEAPELSEQIDRAAKKHNITVLGTGVNPGFIMDTWPLFMTGVCQQVGRIKVSRVQDASFRRGPFQRKIGAGLSLEEFGKQAAAGAIRHVGLKESIGMMAGGLGWKLDAITESIEPVVAASRVETDFVAVEAGQAAGVRQIGKGIMGGEEVITLVFEAAVGASEAYDQVRITGHPNLDLVIQGGINGDVATAAMAINSTPTVMAAGPGLITMNDLPIVHA